MNKAAIKATRKDLERACRLHKALFGFGVLIRWDLMDLLLWWVRQDVDPGPYVDCARRVCKGDPVSPAHKQDLKLLLDVARHIREREGGVVQSPAEPPAQPPAPEPTDVTVVDAGADSLSALKALGWTPAEAVEMDAATVALVLEGQLTGDNARDLLEEQDGALVLQLPDEEPEPEPDDQEPAELSGALSGILQANEVLDLSLLDGESIADSGIIEWDGMDEDLLDELQAAMKARGMKLNP